MTTMMNPYPNGRKRPSLDEQVNRLDHRLERLSAGLNDAVAAAVKAAVGIAGKEAVQAVLTHILSNPAIRARLHPAPETLAQEPIGSEGHQASSLPGFGKLLNRWRQFAAASIARFRAACAKPLRNLQTSAVKTWQGMCEHVSKWRARSEVLRPFRRPLLMAFGISVVVAVAVWYAGPWLAAMVGFVIALAARAGLWPRQALANSAEPAT